MRIIKVASNNHIEGYALFNQNAFNTELKKLISSCALRAGIMRHHVLTIQPYIESDRAELVQLIKDHWDNDFKLVLEKDTEDQWIELSSLSYLSAIDGVLMSLKSLLDVYANVISKSFIPSQNLKFNRGNIEGGDKLAGGKLIKWLQGSIPVKDEKTANILADIITKHSREWITDVVEFRDKIVHDGEIRGLIAAGTSLKIFAEHGFNPQLIRGPYILDNQDIYEYCINILKNTNTFLEETISILPNVNLKLINFKKYGKV